MPKQNKNNKNKNKLSFNKSKKLIWYIKFPFPQCIKHMLGFCEDKKN